MSQANAYEQYMLELVNAERAKTGAQPLAFNADLNESAELHSDWMLDFDTFSHTGVNGSDPGTRMRAAGYQFTGSWTWGENVAWASTRAPAGLQDEVSLLHTNLMNSAGHRANILNAAFREVGIGLEIGGFQSWEAAMVTQNFARSGVNPFLTGVAFDDLDGDRSYDVGEGLGGVTIRITNAAGQVSTTVSTDAGGYQLALPAGSYSVTFSAPNYASQTNVISIGTNNVKLDWIDPAAAAVTPPPPPPPPPPPAQSGINGTAYGDRLAGTAACETIKGLGGSDTLLGLGGDDVLDGGIGNDLLHGGLGRDILTGGSGSDRFVFDTAPGTGNVDRITDFDPVSDTIRLDDAVFTAFTSTGTLRSSAFVRGTAALDASDRILYDPNTGNLFYDADGTGAVAPVLLAELSPNLPVTTSDIQII